MKSTIFETRKTAWFLLSDYTLPDSHCPAKGGIYNMYFKVFAQRKIDSSICFLTFSVHAAIELYRSKYTAAYLPYYILAKTNTAKLPLQKKPHM